MVPHEHIMRLLLYTTTDRDGAGIAASRLNQGLNQLDIVSNILVQKKLSSDPKIIGPKSQIQKGIANIKSYFDALPLQLIKHKEDTMFSVPWLPGKVVKTAKDLSPDIINLHWVCKGYLQIESLTKFSTPIVWTLHDMWAFTGGCHYSGGCEQYTAVCGKCPQLGSQSSWDLSRWVWYRKASSWKSMNLTIVSPSSWLAQCAKSSSLFKELRVEIIPNGIDTQVYKPIDRDLVRDLLNLPKDKILLLFGSANVNDRRKGWHHLKKALEGLIATGWKDKIELVIFGSNHSGKDFFPEFKTHYFGRLQDDISLALIYAAANVFVLPSMQDNLPNTIMEALACGTPCVAFNIGGISDMVEHLQNGYLAEAYNTEDLVKGILWLIDNNEKYVELCKNSRAKVENNFGIELQAQRYSKLFHEILNSKKKL